MKHSMDKETILACAILALGIAAGILFSGLGFMGIDIMKCNSTLVITIYMVLTGGIWLTLLMRNC